MIVRFEPSGTHVKGKMVYIRLDVFPDVGDKTYPRYRVNVVDDNSAECQAGYQGAVDGTGHPIDPADYRNWLDSLPKILRTNPILCHFITIDPGTTLAQLATKLRAMYDSSTIASLDDILSELNSLKPLAALMRTKKNPASALTGTPNLPDLISTINARFAPLQVTVTGKG